MRFGHNLEQALVLNAVHDQIMNGHHGNVVLAGKFGQLVASAEQGFIEKMIEGTLPLGRYMSASPCFRDDAIDEMHCREFFKVELIQTLDIDGNGLSEIIEEAFNLFSTMLPSIQHLEIVKTEQGFDLELGGIEIGSYGIREFGDFKWIYGTGLAEPRFSRARNAIYGK